MALSEIPLYEQQILKWWSTLKTVVFGVHVALPLLLRPDGSLTHCPKEKAVLFADVLDSKQSNNSLTMPQLCFPEAELTKFAFCFIKS